MQKSADGRLVGLSPAAPAPAVPAPAAPAAATPPTPTATVNGVAVSNASEMEAIGEPGRTVPDRPSGYQILKLPGGPALEQEHVEEVTGAVHAAGYSQGDLDALVFARQISKHEMHNGARVEQASKNAERELRRLWGDHYEQNLAIALAEARTLRTSSPVLKHAFESTTMGSAGNRAMA